MDEIVLLGRVRVWSLGLIKQGHCSSAWLGRSRSNIINLSVRTGRPKGNALIERWRQAVHLWPRRSISIYALVPRRYLLEIIIRAVVKSWTGPFLRWYLTRPVDRGPLHVPLYKVSLLLSIFFKHRGSFRKLFYHFYPLHRWLVGVAWLRCAKDLWESKDLMNNRVVDRYISRFNFTEANILLPRISRGRNFPVTRDYSERLSANINMVVCILCATGARHRCRSLLSFQ